MWGIVLILTGVFFLVLALVHIWLSFAAIRGAGVAWLNLRTPLHDLPKPERQKLLHSLRRRQSVAPEHRDAARRWAGQELLRRGLCWAFVWLTAACAALLSVSAVDPGASSPFEFWTFLVLTCLCAVFGLVMWGNQVTARRVLRDTTPPA
jgi:hypothetical protein